MTAACLYLQYRAGAAGSVPPSRTEGKCGWSPLRRGRSDQPPAGAAGPVPPSRTGESAAGSRSAAGGVTNQRSPSADAAGLGPAPAAGGGGAWTSPANCVPRHRYGC